MRIEDLCPCLLAILKLPMRLFGDDELILLNLTSMLNNEDPLICDKAFLKRLLTISKQGEIGHIQDKDVFYSYYNHDKKILIIGPFFDTCDNGRLASLKHCTDHHCVFKQIPHGDLNQVISALVMMASAINKKALNLNAFIGGYPIECRLIRETKRQISSVLNRQLEEVSPHNDAQYENRIRNAIAKGDKNALKLALSTPFVGKRGVIGHSPLRSLKNLCIVDITIASRAAIDAGLNAELSYIISDGYILQIELLENSRDILAVYEKCAFDFCDRVKEYKSITDGDHANYLVRKVDDYLTRFFFKKVCVKDLAKSCNLSPDYLMKQYKEHANKTIMQKLKEIRIAAGKDLLLNTDLSIADIAVKIGFYSQSHMTIVFKEYERITPAKYRKQRESANIENLLGNKN